MTARKKPEPKTSMTIKEVHLVPAGDNKGDLVINIVAKRSRRTYKFPYHIKKHNIANVDIEYLKAKVRSDIDSLEAEASRENTVIDRLSNLLDTKIGLD